MNFSDRCKADKLQGGGEWEEETSFLTIISFVTITVQFFYKNSSLLGDCCFSLRLHFAQLKHQNV